MSVAAGEGASAWAGRAQARYGAALTNAAKAAGPPLLFGLRLWASVCLSLYIAFRLQLDNASWAGVTAAIVCQPHVGASLRKGWYRMVGTMVGAVAIVVITGLFPQARAPFLVALAMWGAACALVATLLHNYAAYAAALAGFTAVVIASDTLGQTGGPHADKVFMLAVTRASEICIGIVSAGIILAGTDFGGARRRLAASFAALSAEIVGRFTGMLALAGSDLPETQPIRRELVRRVIALDPVIDEAKGESSQLRYHSPVLQMAVDGLFAALCSWRTVAVRLARQPDEAAQQETAAVLRNIPQDLRSAESGVPPCWIDDPIRVRQACEAAARALMALPARAPSQRLLADQTARLLDGISDALNGLTLLIAGFALSSPRGGGVQIRVPDWLPAFVNAGRTFVTIGAAALFWIYTEWPNGAPAIAFAAIAVIVFAPRADQAYGAAADKVAGVILAAVFSAVILFALLPGLETFEAFSLVLALLLVPGGALMAQPRHTLMFTYMTAYSCALIAPANEQSYDTQQFYNSALALVAGTGVAALSFRLLPPLSPALRTRRLLALTLRDLRRLAAGRVSQAASDWQGRIIGRLAALPERAEPLQRAQLVAALAAGSEIIELRGIATALGFGTALGGALDALVQGDSALAAALLMRLEERLAAFPGSGPEASLALRARGSILAISEALHDHAAYFDAGGPL